MQRYHHITEMLGPHTVELYSELEPGQTYSLEGNELTYQGEQEGRHIFGQDDHEQTYSTADLQQLIDAGDVKTVGNPATEQTVTTFPNLDRFTRQTFGAPTRTLWTDANLNMDETDLYTLDELIARHNISEMPLPGEGEYPALLADRHWPVLKRYLLALSPDSDLPEELG